MKKPIVHETPRTSKSAASAAKLSNLFSPAREVKKRREEERSQILQRIIADISPLMSTDTGVYFGSIKNGLVHGVFDLTNEPG